MKNKPDDYFNNGIVEMARWGRHMKKRDFKRLCEEIKENRRFG